MRLSSSLLQRAGEGICRLHPLIQEFLREKLRHSAPVSEFKRGFVAAMVRVAKQIPESPTRQQLHAVAPAIPHVLELVKDKNLLDLLREEDLIAPFQGLGWFYKGQGLYERA